MTPRTAVVTGAGRGIGAALAGALAEAGWRLALLGRTRSHLEDVAGRIGDRAPAPLVVPVDVADPASVRRAADDVLRELGGVGLLVHNAGVVERTEAPFAADDVEDVWRVVETNLRGPMLLTHALLPAMLAQGGARVVHLNSGAGYKASSAYTGYGVSKGALARLTTLLDAQHRADGLLVFDVAPGVVVTDMTGSMPLHGSRTDWTPVDRVQALVLAIGEGRLDALAGRFLHAGFDDPDRLVDATDQILAADARRLDLVRWGQDDPIPR